jgi:hypothetical protein
VIRSERTIQEEKNESVDFVNVETERQREMSVLWKHLQVILFGEKR